MAVKVDVNTCVGRDACVGVYLAGTLSMNDDGKSACGEKTCIGCGSCVGICPISAISQ